MKIFAALVGLLQASPMLIGQSRGSHAPGYLDLPYLDECTGTKDYGTWQGICVPATPPAACTTEKHLRTHRLLSSEGHYNIPSC
ncbi:Oidioi.mRNA.OKI2018_I69.chr2.g6424.t1.cds [Oikopleura dioica]|uniref:Oidioi.mRNA.OKI2018_I69.chr2.g6424.t1.cds n=1 Tax=Oikopleura dioica TaxID=34765 RepID=A0ABN7T3M1_OIKDI|nr:Oidioi.mRNA.OKI2018_I69.chr2.g6424.t1.cds [Oikopleura dioica]